MKTLVTALLLCLLSLPALAVNRLLPTNIMAGTIASVDGNTVTFVKSESSLLRALVAALIPTGQSYATAPGLRIFDGDNRFLLTGQLPTLVGQTVGITLDMQGNINRIWVLSDAEIALLQQQQQ
ncbi:MAG: hypothetical protein JO338_00750 [Aquitalea sp.]|nr:hypothetical protein [Aquitalea sp.]